jgi:hypothetical protein
MRRRNHRRSDPALSAGQDEYHPLSNILAIVASFAETRPTGKSKVLDQRSTVDGRF